MKILTIAINYLPTVGGISNHIFHLNEHLYKQGIDVSILQIIENSSKSEFFYENVKDSLFPLYRLHIKKELTFRTSFIYRKMILAVIEREFSNIDLIHLHEFKNTEFLLYKSKYKWIYTNHSTHFIYMMTHKSLKKIILKHFMKRIFNNASYIISISSIMEKLTNELLNKKNKSIFIPNGVDIEKFSHISIDSRFELPIDKTIVLIPARWHNIKGIHVVVNAMKKLKKQENNFFFVFAGAGEGDKDYIETIYKELESLDNYKIYDFIYYERMASLYSRSNIILLPSLYETGGIVPLEAMASKKIILSANVGNIPNIITNRNNGLLFESENENELVLLLFFIQNNKMECNRIISNGFEFVQKYYSWNSISKKTIEIYKQVIKMDKNEL